MYLCQIIFYFFWDLMNQYIALSFYRKNNFSRYKYIYFVLFQIVVFISQLSLLYYNAVIYSH